jgi:CRP/FNR family transcriptional regulator, cyclic AMP receptor protein
VRQGEILFSRGDEADGLYMLLAGNVLLREMDHRLGAGDLFGEIALGRSSPHTNRGGCW